MSSRASLYWGGSRAAIRCASHSVVWFVRRWILWAFFLVSVSPAFAGAVYAQGNSATNPSPTSVSATTPAAGGGSDTQPPTVPTSLTANTASGAAITLSWGASTDDVGVTAYLVELCQGAGCTAFSQVTSSATSPFTVSGLVALTSYTFRIRATDAVGNLSAYSNAVSATTGLSGSICD
jgi:hypothetical protein